MSFSHWLKEKATSVWEEGYRHPFVQGLGAGTLDQEIFKFYLLQDYLYLLQYAKVFALGTVKASREEWMRNFTESQYSILATEMNIHREYMTRFGITAEEIANAKPSLFNQAYTANMLTQGQTGGLAELLAAVFPCAWTYADYGKRLKAEYADRLEGNFYKFWIEGYAGDEFWESFEWFFDAMDELVTGYTEEQKQHIADIFVSSVEFEYLFWDMAYKRQMSF
jgi:thiaminase/transcriptional activator TenA